MRVINIEKVNEKLSESVSALEQATAELGTVAATAHETATDTEAAAAELGVIASQAVLDGTDTQAAVAELGGMVADLTVRVEALEGAKS